MNHHDRYLSTLLPGVLEELREKSKSRIYRSDPEAWMADVLNKRWWSKQAEVAHMVVNPGRAQTMTAVKSCNGVGKTQIAGDLATWAVAVHDPLEVSVLLTAPIFGQIRANTFRYIADNYGVARENGFHLPGYMMSIPSLRVDRAGGGLPKDVIQAKRPADSNLISSFQGTHDGYVMVILDEAGGLPEDLWIGANAVTTNEHVAILAIGNPDEIGTPFHQRFQNRDKFQEWQTLTISAYDSPNFTGELIYPDDPERDKFVKSHLIQPAWADMMIRQAHPSVVQAKVYGEFPEDADNAYFPQSILNVAYDTDIDPDIEVSTMGVDFAMEGEDETVCYLNQGGNIRLYDSWGKMTNYMDAARRIHQVALSSGCKALVMDAGGIGASVFSLLDTQPEFSAKTYQIAGFKGAHASPDRSRWVNMRGWSYDRLREKMQMGLIDLDMDDQKLKDEILRQTFKVDKQGRIHPTPKDELRKAGIKSPDHLDALTYASIDILDLLNDPVNQLQPGTRVQVNPWEQLQLNRVGPGKPI